MPDTQHEKPHQRFDRLRGTIGLFVGPAAFLLILALPLDLSPQAHRLAAVFGLVISGMSIVDEIQAVGVERRSGMDNVPKQTVTILSIERL